MLILKQKTVKKTLLTLLFLNCYALFSQGTIKGKITDTTTKQGLPYVNILCKDTNKKLISGGITNAKGNFLVSKLPLQNLHVEIQFIGYKTITKEITLSKDQKTFDFGTITITEDATLLKEVEIKGQTTTITNKIDRKIINIGKDLTATGSNALELMQNIPGITVDIASGNISLRGNLNPRVLINGKPSTLNTQQALKQIPTSSIKNIEIITNPSAKYSPDGMSGMINIVLKKNTKNGFNGVLDLNANYSENLRTGSSLNLNYRTGKVNFYTNLSGDYGDLHTITTINREDKKLDQQFDFIDSSIGKYLKVGTDIYLDDKNTLSFYTNQNFTDTDFSTVSKINENIGQTYNANNLQIFNISEASYNADYKVSLDDKGQNLEIEFNYTISKDPENGVFKENINPSSTLNNYTNSIINTRKLYLANIDYEKPISKRAKIEVGLEARILNIDNKINTTQEVITNLTPSIQPVGNSVFDYTRNIYSAYINYNKEFNKFSFQGGLRFEQFNVEALFNNTQQGDLPAYNEDIFNVFPSAFLTYIPDDNNEFSVSYSKRIDRPAIYQISPIREWSSPYTISVGNSELKPQYTNSFELGYTHYIKTGYLSFNTFYRNTNDVIGRSSLLDPVNQDRQFLDFKNYNRSDSYGLEFYSSIKPKKWWTITPITLLYFQKRQGIIANKNVEINNTKLTIQLRNNFQLSKRFSTQLSYVYAGKDQGILYTREAYSSISGGARLSVLNGKGNLKLRFSDIFNILDLKLSGTNPYPINGLVDKEIRRVSLGFTYNFGSGKNKALNRKDREDNETHNNGVL